MFSTYHLHITPRHSTMLGTKFQGDTTFTSHVTGCQLHVGYKAPFRRLDHEYFST